MTKTFEEKQFNVPKLKGLSEKSIEEHLKLYSGYVKHLNLIHEIVENPENPEYARREAYRRQGFEFGGMRNHEYYFAHFENGSTALATSGPLYEAVVDEWGNFDKWLNRFKSIALIRGIGWAILYYDSHTKRLLNAWVDEHHLGQLTGLAPVVVLDMWEHAYFIDYTPAEKKKYIEAFFENLNWQSAEQNFADAQQI